MVVFNYLSGIESIPDWLTNWMPDNGGYLAGNIGPGCMDFRFFALGNLIAISTGLASKKMAEDIFDLYEARWENLVGKMPLTICYPALEGSEWSEVAWRYHEANLRMRARAGRLWVVTVDNCHPEHWPCSAPSGVVAPDGSWAVKAEPWGEWFFSHTIAL